MTSWVDDRQQLKTENTSNEGQVQSDLVIPFQYLVCL